MTQSPYYFFGTMDEDALRRYAAHAVTYLPLCDHDATLEEGIRLS